MDSSLGYEAMKHGRNFSPASGYQQQKSIVELEQTNHVADQDGLVSGRSFLVGRTRAVSSR